MPTILSAIYSAFSTTNDSTIFATHITAFCAANHPAFWTTYCNSYKSTKYATVSSTDMPTDYTTNFAAHSAA